MNTTRPPGRSPGSTSATPAELLPLTFVVYMGRKDAYGQLVGAEHFRVAAKDAGIAESVALMYCRPHWQITGSRHATIEDRQPWLVGHAS